MLFTEEHPEPIIQAAQLCGARLTKAPFFPRWMVNKYAESKQISVVESKRPHYYEVCVFSLDKAHHEAAIVYVKSKKPNHEPPI